MKKKKLTNALVKVIAVLAIILVALISFLGINKRNLNGWRKVLPEFNLSKELGEVRIFSFVTSTATKEVEENSDETKDEADTQATEEQTADNTKNETNSESTDNQSSSSEKKEVPVNDSSVLNKDNYKKVKNIIEERIKKFGISDSTVSVDDESGEVSISVPQTNISDYLVSLVTKQGKVEIIDSDTKEVLISRNMIKDVSAYYVQSNDSSTSTNSSEITYDEGIKFEFTSEGQKKLNEISKNYIETTDEDGNTSQKTITLKIDDEEKYKTYFSPDGNYTNLAIPLYQGVSVDDMTTFNDNYAECRIISTCLNNDEMPIIYTVSTGTYIESNLGENFIMYTVIVGVMILVVVALGMIIKFKKNGILMALIEIGYVAILLLLIRAASVSITLTGLIMILFMSLINVFLLCLMLDKHKAMKFGKFILNLIPLLITIIVFVFAKDVNISSIGSVGFYGFITFIYTYLISILLLNDVKNDEKNGVE